MLAGTIHFNNIPKPTIEEEYWYSNVELDKNYRIIDSYEKMVNNKSRHFFLIQEYDNTSGPLFEIPLTSDFTFLRYDK